MTLILVETKPIFLEIWYRGLFICLVLNHNKNLNVAIIGILNWLFNDLYENCSVPQQLKYTHTWQVTKTQCVGQLRWMGLMDIFVLISYATFSTTMRSMSNVVYHNHWLNPKVMTKFDVKHWNMWHDGHPISKYIPKYARGLNKKDNLFTPIETCGLKEWKIKKTNVYRFQALTWIWARWPCHAQESPCSRGRVYYPPLRYVFSLWDIYIVSTDGPICGR